MNFFDIKIAGPFYRILGAEFGLLHNINKMVCLSPLFVVSGGVFSPLSTAVLSGAVFHEDFPCARSEAGYITIRQTHSLRRLVDGLEVMGCYRILYFDKYRHTKSIKRPGSV